MQLLLQSGMNDTDPICKRAIIEAGGAIKLARKLGCTHQAIYKWKRVPSSKLGAVAIHSRISKERLRPDLYGLAAAVEPKAKDAAE